MLETCEACGQDFLTEADPYVVRPTPQGYLLYCSCMILGEGQTNEFISADRIAALEQLAEWAAATKLDAPDLNHWASMLKSMAQELMEVKG